MLVQHVAAKLGDSLGELSQLCKQLLSVKLRMFRAMVVGTDSIHPSGCSILLRPEEKGIYRHYGEILTDKSSKEGRSTKRVTIKDDHYWEMDKNSNYLREVSLQSE